MTREYSKDEAVDTIAENIEECLDAVEMGLNTIIDTGGKVDPEERLLIRRKLERLHTLVEFNLQTKGDEEE